MRQSLMLNAGSDDDGSPLRMSAELAWPEPAVLTGESVTVFVCLPGGGMTGRYFDLDARDSLGTFSMSEHLASAGAVVAAIDHLGTGRSDAPTEAWSLTPLTLGAATSCAVSGIAAYVTAQLPAGTKLDLVGVGHSMGGLIAVVTQAHHRSFDALALLGFSGRGLPEAHTPDEARVVAAAHVDEPTLVDLARKRFGRSTPASATSTSDLLVVTPICAEVRAALKEASAPMLAVAGTASMLRGSIAAELAAVDVPVFVGIAEHDIAGPPHDIPRDLPSSSDITLYVLPGAGHNSNVAPNRHQLWNRMHDWARCVSVRR